MARSLTPRPISAYACSAAVLALTVLHHLYGAWRYATPWRHHVALIVVPLLIVLTMAFVTLGRSNGARVRLAATWTFLGIGVAASVGWIGLFEGGYAHVLKNLLYFGGLPRTTFDTLFPAPTYEVPDDVLFEATGIAQFLLAMPAALHLLRFWREVRTGV